MSTLPQCIASHSGFSFFHTPPCAIIRQIYPIKETRTRVNLVEEFKRHRGRLFVVSGPSGVGKDTALDQFFLRVSGVVRSVSATTRPPRPGEREGVDYFFLSTPEFEKRIETQGFLEWALYGHNHYGTPRDRVEAWLNEGNDVVLKIEVQGALSIKTLAPDARLVFLQPPSLEELERRLRARDTDTEEKVQERLAIAREELAHRREYHYLITNDNLEAAVNALCAIVLAERCKIAPE